MGQFVNLGGNISQLFYPGKTNEYEPYNTQQMKDSRGHGGAAPRMYWLFLLVNASHSSQLVLKGQLLLTITFAFSPVDGTSTQTTGSSPRRVLRRGCIERGPSQGMRVDVGIGHRALVYFGECLFPFGAAASKFVGHRNVYMYDTDNFNNINIQKADITRNHQITQFHCPICLPCVRGSRGCSVDGACRTCGIDGSP